MNYKNVIKKSRHQISRENRGHWSSSNVMKNDVIYDDVIFFLRLILKLNIKILKTTTRKGLRNHEKTLWTWQDYTKLLIRRSFRRAILIQ